MDNTDKLFEKELHSALAHFEEHLETPVVPGELESWLRQVHEACLQAGVMWCQRVQHGHSQLLQEIGEEDPALLTRVEQMQQGDKELGEQFESLCRDAEEFAQYADLVEPRETKVEGHVEQFVQDGLQFVLDVRKQENALATWLQEALQRDRGVAD